MKAIIISQPGPPDVLQIQERPKPLPGKREVLLKVKAAGVNAPDIFQRKGNYPAPPGAPSDIPGLEVAGIIDQCGEGVIHWKQGDAVCALLGGGGYAEFAVVHEDHCLPIPYSWDLINAASLPETIFTVWHNVFQRGKLKANEHLLVHGGSSGIGITAIQLAKAWGAYVTITAGTEEKCNACRLLGADQTIHYKSQDFESILKAQGVDVILDMVGGDYIPKNIRLLKEDGRLVFINAIKGGKAEWNALDIMQKRLTITGSTLRKRDAIFKGYLAKDIHKNVWPLIEANKFKPVIYKTFPLAEAARAHALIESGTHIGKIVLVV
ncbi:MAG: NAD(P)H-quinone oxidoreductase [Cyclobacteriaceae bacterium]